MYIAYLKHTLPSCSILFGYRTIWICQLRSIVAPVHLIMKMTDYSNWNQKPVASRMAFAKAFTICSLYEICPSFLDHTSLKGLELGSVTSIYDFVASLITA